MGRFTFQHHYLVSGIDVQAPAIERECDRVVVQRAVSAGIML